MLWKPSGFQHCCQAIQGVSGLLPTGCLYNVFTSKKKKQIRKITATMPGFNAIGGRDLPRATELDIACEELRAITITDFTTPNLEKLTCESVANWTPFLNFRRHVLLFDYSSVTSMSCLEDLTLASSDQGHHNQNQRLVRIPNLSQYACFLDGTMSMVTRDRVWRED